jgi:hypothetical protein
VEGDGPTPWAATILPFEDASYEALLAKGRFMADNMIGISEDSQTACRTLLEKKYAVPRGSLFDDDTFDGACKMIDGSYAAKVVHVVGRLLVPSVEIMAVRYTPLRHRVESHNQR